MVSKNNRKNYIFLSKLFLLTAIFVYMFSFIFYSEDIFVFFSLKYLSFIPILIITIHEIVKDNNAISLNKIHWYFILIFMTLAPVSQIRSNYCPWGFLWDDNLIIRANMIVLLWVIMYSYSYHKNKKVHIRLSDNSSIKKENGVKLGIHLSLFSRAAMLFLTLISTFIMIRAYGFNNLFIRGTQGFEESTFRIVFEYLLRSIPAINCCIFVLAKKRGEKVTLFEIVILFVCVFILNSPVALSRFWTGVVYLGIIVCIVPLQWFKNHRFDYLVFFALLVIFPLFSLFKRNTLGEVVDRGYSINLITVYNNVDYDAYSVMCKVIQYVQYNDFTFGGQVKGVIFFFVPRSFIEIKGTPTGEMVATYFNSYFTNVASPIMSEGYVDFGLFGVMLYAFLFGKIFKYFDMIFDSKYTASHTVIYKEIVSPFLLGFVIFVMRGALQPTFLRVMGFFLYLMIFYMVKRISLYLKDYSS